MSKKIPTPDTLYRDIHNLSQSVRENKTNPRAFDQHSNDLIDMMMTLCRREGISEQQMLDVFAHHDPNNILDWYKHFFRNTK